MAISVYTAGLRQAADGIEVAVAGARERVRDCLEPSAEAVGGNAGWASAGALAGCREVWASHLDDLVVRTGAAVERLRASAADYDEVERRVVASLTELR